MTLLCFFSIFRDMIWYTTKLVWRKYESSYYYPFFVVDKCGFKFLFWKWKPCRCDAKGKANKLWGYVGWCGSRQGIFQLLSQSGLFYKLYAWIDFCLMLQSVVVDQVLSPGVRVTVAMGADRDLGTVNLFIISQLSYSFVFFALRKTCIYSFKLMNIGFGSSRFSTSDCSAL